VLPGHHSAAYRQRTEDGAPRWNSRPTQAGVAAHCLAVADATALPVMLYDVPHRTGTPFSAATLAELGILDHAKVRLPLLESPPEDLEKLRLALARAPLAA
jgi:4-hydroxy-tetrahydrodipicolinate synthase